MKKILILIGSILLVVIIYGGLRFYLNSSNIVSINQTAEGNYIDVTVEQGEYEVGDLVYLVYDEQTTTEYIFDTVMALEDEEVIGMYEITEQDVVTLETEDLDVEMEVLVTAEEIDKIGISKMQRNIKVKQTNKNEGDETKEQIREKVKSQFEEKQQKFEENENSNQSDNSNATNTENGSNKTEESGSSNQNDNSNANNTESGSNQSDNAVSNSNN